MVEAHRGAANCALFSYPGLPWLFPPYPYREHWRRFQPVRRFSRALENGHADRLFGDRIGRGFGVAVEKPPRSCCDWDWIVADYGRGFRKPVGSSSPRTRGRLSAVLLQAVSVAGV